MTKLAEFVMTRFGLFLLVLSAALISFVSASQDSIVEVKTMEEVRTMKGYICALKEDLEKSKCRYTCDSREPINNHNPVKRLFTPWLDLISPLSQDNYGFIGAILWMALWLIGCVTIVALTISITIMIGFLGFALLWAAYKFFMSAFYLLFDSTGVITGLYFNQIVFWFERRNVGTLPYTPVSAEKVKKTLTGDRE